MYGPFNIPMPTLAELRPHSREPGKLLELLELLTWLDTGPVDPAKYRQAAKWLDANVPPQLVAVRDLMKVPVWAMRTWLDELWCDANEFELPVMNEGIDNPYHELDAWGFFDHWGVTRVFGVAAILTEPYNLSADGPAWQNTDPDSGAVLLRMIGRRCGGVAIWSPNAAWPSKWASRVLILPYADRFPRVFERQAMKAYYRPDLFHSPGRIARGMLGESNPPWFSKIKPSVRLA